MCTAVHVTTLQSLPQRRVLATVHARRGGPPLGRSTLVESISTANPSTAPWSGVDAMRSHVDAVVRVQPRSESLRHKQAVNDDDDEYARV
eukprot:COSAG01_NODE_6913_length_3441_cov_8.635357_2_plen_90_part_00